MSEKIISSILIFFNYNCLFQKYVGTLPQGQPLIMAITFSRSLYAARTELQSDIFLNKEPFNTVTPSLKRSGFFVAHW